MRDFITTRTPLRISFAGGGTDLKSAVEAMGEPGMVLNMAINKYVYIIVKKHSHLFDEKYRLNYSENELRANRNDIKNRLIKETLTFLDIDENLFISSIADIPAGTGLGSSSAFTIGLLNALHHYRGDKNISQYKLAEEAVEIESKRINESIGSQDQFGCAIGGLKFLQIDIDNGVKILRKEDNLNNLNYLTENIILVWTEKTRKANEILNKQAKSNKSNRNILLNLKKDAINANLFCLNNDLNSLVDLIDESWLRKKSLISEISNQNICNTIDLLKKNKINGCKLLGAGGGGFIMGFNLNNVKNLSQKCSKKIIKIKPDVEGSVIL